MAGIHDRKALSLLLLPLGIKPFLGTETVVIPFNAFTSDDPSASATVTNLANTDVVIYKDGSFTPEELAKIMPQTLTKGRTADTLPDVLPFKLTIPGMK